MEKIKYRVKEIPPKSESQKKPNKMHIFKALFDFEDGVRVISVGIIEDTQYETITPFNVVSTVLSPIDKYSPEIAEKILEGRYEKNKRLPLKVDLMYGKPTRNFIESIADIAIYQVLADLKKRYKQVYPKKS